MPYQGADSSSLGGRSAAFSARRALLSSSWGMPVSYQGDTPPGLKSRDFSAGGNAASASQIRRVRAATLALPHERVTLVGAPAVVLAGQAIMRRGGVIRRQGYSSGSDD